MGQYLTSEVAVLAEDTTSVTVRLRIFYNTTAGVSDSSNDFDMVGQWANESNVVKNVSVPSGGGSQLIYDNTQVFGKAYGAPYGVNFSCEFTGINFWGASQVMSASGGYTVAARPWDPPAAPTGVTATRNSDTSHTITWTTHATASAPYEGQRVYRSADGGGWADISGLIAYNATSYTDTTTSANHAYSYLIVAGNSTAAVQSAWTPTIYTTPTGPTGASAAKDASGNIIVTWVNNAPYGYPEVWHAANGVWDGTPLSGTNVLAPGTTTYTHTAPSSGVTHTYRVYATTPTPFLRSGASSESNVVQLTAPPSAPTGLAASVNPVPITETTRLSWVHNPTDSTPQTKREIQYRKQGTTPWTSGGQVTTALGYLDVTPSSWGAANGEVWEWQVRTWGTHATASAWSATATLTLSARPTAALSSPAATVTTSKVTAAWTYFDAEGGAQSAWQVDLLSGASVVETKSGAGTAASVQMATTLANGSSWTIRVRVADPNGLWSAYATQAFTVAYALPPVPGVTLEWAAETGSVLITIENPAPSGGEVAAVTNDVWRSIDDGPWTLIAAGVPTNTTVQDFSPTVAGTNHYRVDAISATPSTATSAVVDYVAEPSIWFYLSTGPQWSTVARFWGNPKVKTSDSRAKATEWFEGREDESGTAYPVAMFGSAVTSTLAYSGLLTNDSSGPDVLREIGHSDRVCLWRDFTGRYWYVVPGEVSIDEWDPIPGLATVSFTLTRVSA